ncbi:MAG: hypothetical protein OEZ35_07965 [Candidatus Bathyarchaeota archaeon]|nr:hypothetical protein [Candidatus Bathyarchaeota archaeon]
MVKAFVNESFDADFMHEVADTPGGRGVRACCGGCEISVLDARALARTV